MTADTAVAAIVISLAVGYYFAKWRRAEKSKQGAKQDLGKAAKGAWLARRVMAIAAVFAVVAAYEWLHSHHGM
ncbi:MAG: hypothetical protein ACHP9Z_23670 [Streptosporangiales bacterium]